MRVGIVGLGDQGRPIAQRVMAAGHALRFFARRADVRDEFVARGAQPCTVVELGRDSEVVLVVVVDDAQVRDVVVEQGLLGAMRPGSTLVIHSTVHPATCVDLARLAAASGVQLLDAPVSGGRDRSYAGDLTLLVGGDAAALKAARPVLEAYGSTLVHMGGVGSGQTAKLLNNYFYAAHLATAAKAVELVHALGIDVGAAAQALPRCSGASAVLAMQAARGFERTRHDKGTAHAVGILSEAVGALRGLAAKRGVELGVVDRLVDAGLAHEVQRAEAEA